MFYSFQSGRRSEHRERQARAQARRQRHRRHEGRGQGQQEQVLGRFPDGELFSVCFSSPSETKSCCMLNKVH